MPGMSQDPNQNRVAGITGAEAKTPLDRAKQIQEMQRQLESTPVQPQPAGPAQVKDTQAAVSTTLQKAVEVFDAKPVEQVNLIKGPSNTAADSGVYGAKQVDESALFGAKSSDIEVTGPVWKVIPFGPPQTSALADLKKPLENYHVHIPQQTVKHKEGNLFQLTFTPKAGGEAPVKKAVITDDKGNLKGAEVKNKGQLERILTEVPQFTLSLFQSVFGEGVQKDSPKTQHRVVSVETGKKSAYEVKIERKNDLDGKWKSETVTLNNFGLRVPPSNDPRRHDIVVAMYYLDRFQAG